MKFFIGIFLFFSLLCPISSVYVHFSLIDNNISGECEVEELVSSLRKEENEYIQKHKNKNKYPSIFSLHGLKDSNFSSGIKSESYSHFTYKLALSKSIMSSVLTC